MAKLVVKIKDEYLLDKNFYVSYNPFIVIHESYFDSIRLLDNYGFVNSLDVKGFDGIIGIIKQYNLQLENCFYLIDNNHVVELIIRAYKVTGQKTENLLNFFSIEIPYEILEKVSAELLANPSIEYLYERGELVELAPHEKEHFLNPKNILSSPDAYPYIHDLFQNFGVDNIEANEHNVNVVLIDQGWDLTLVRRPIGSASIEQLGSGINFSGSTHSNHGTNTLNVLTGSRDSNDNLLDGLCMQATHYVSSTWYYDSIKRIPVEQRESTLVEVFISDRLFDGDIVLLELQVEINGPNYYPIEIEPLTFILISLGTIIGLNIIEPAGNGSKDLDIQIGMIDQSYVQISDILSSGATMVGAVSKNLTIKENSNHGTRLDCYCYGDAVWTRKRISYDSTSLASAIMTALAANIQTLAKANGKLINPDSMKKIMHCIDVRTIPPPNSYQIPSPDEFMSFINLP